MSFIPNTDDDRATMLAALGLDSVAQLFADIPAPLRQPSLALPEGLAELELTHLLGQMAAQNADTERHPCFLGAGAYHHFIPAVIGHILSRGEFLTSYTPYQAEISQGTLQSMYEFQSLICQLAAMDAANASMYDGASALAEAALLALRVTRRARLALAPTVHPEYRATLETYASALGVELASPPLNPGRGTLDGAWLDAALSQDTAALIVQHPNFYGCLEEVEALSAAARQVEALFIVCFDPISLGLLKPPGAYGADVAVGEGQPLGLPPSFGGPYLGLFACREAYLRQMPGRLVGQTVDGQGRRGFVLTLQTREQHIRREKATSNICTSEALCALAAAVYLAYMGRRGLRQVAELCLQKAHYAAQRIAALPGYDLAFQEPFFKEFVVRCRRKPPEGINAQLLAEGIIGGLPLSRVDPKLADSMLFCVTEMNTKAQIDKLVEVLGR